MKNITLFLTIVFMSIGLVGCQNNDEVEKEQHVTNKESLHSYTDSGSQNEVDTIHSVYKSKDSKISIFVEQERYNQGDTPVITIRNDGKTSVQYTGIGTILEHLQDDVWIPEDNATVDILNGLEPGKEIEQKIPPSSLQKGVYRLVFIFSPDSNEDKNSKRVAVSFYVD